MPIPTFEGLFKKSDQCDFLEKYGYDLESSIDQPSDMTDRFCIHDVIFHGKEDKFTLEMLEILIKNGVDINLSSGENLYMYSTGQSPLSVALATGRKDIAAWLIKEKADVKQTDDEGEFPLIKSARRGLSGDCSSLVALLEAGADINQENVTSKENKHMNALMYAAKARSLKSAYLLIDKGANLTNSQGKYVLDYCADEYTKKKLGEYIKQKEKIEDEQKKENQMRASDGDEKQSNDSNSATNTPPSSSPLISRKNSTLSHSDNDSSGMSLSSLSLSRQSSASNHNEEVPLSSENSPKEEQVRQKIKAPITSSISLGFIDLGKFIAPNTPDTPVSISNTKMRIRSNSL